jgi:hypothetical protein
MGYRYLFNPPKRGMLTANVNVSVLFAQWIAASLIAAIGWLLLDKRDGYQHREPKDRDPDDKSVFESASFTLLRSIRGVFGFIFGWQIVSLLPILTWFFQPASITDVMMAKVTVKIVIMVVFSLLFFLFGKIIHVLHNKWYGFPHPQLQKKFDL